MNKSILPILTLIIAAIMTTGCHSGPYTPQTNGQPDLENHEKVVLMDGMVQRSVATPSLQVTPLADGRMQVVCNVRNRETRRIQVQIQCVFKDANGFPTGDETPWTNLILTENAQEGVPFTSMNNLAKNYTIRIRQPH
jgi:uncharacterized protein YcfL